MLQPFLITLTSPHDPREIRGWHDGSLAGFSTDLQRAKSSETLVSARITLDELRRRFPRQAINLRTLGFAAGLALTACAPAPPPPVASASNKVKNCAVQEAELHHHGMFFGPFPIDMGLTPTAQEARAARQSAETSPEIPCPVFAPEAPEVAQPAANPIILLPPPSSCAWAGRTGGCV
jgi:hypothetical protein